MSVLAHPSPTNDLRILERTVPAHMLVLMLEEAAKIGFELRADTQHRLNMAAAAPMAKLDQLGVARLAKKTDDIATTLLHLLNPDDPRDGVYCCAQFILTLVAEGRLADKTNMAVLVSLQLMDDVRDDNPDKNGEMPVWKLNEIGWKTRAGKLLHRAVLMGLYVGRTIDA